MPIQCQSGSNPMPIQCQSRLSCANAMSIPGQSKAIPLPIRCQSIANAAPILCQFGADMMSIKSQFSCNPVNIRCRSIANPPPIGQICHLSIKSLLHTSSSAKRQHWIVTNRQRIGTDHANPTLSEDVCACNLGTSILYGPTTSLNGGPFHKKILRHSTASPRSLTNR